MREGYNIRRATEADFDEVHKLYYDGLLEIIPKTYKTKVLRNVPFQMVLLGCSLILAMYVLDRQGIMACLCLFIASNILMYLVVHFEYIARLGKYVITEGKNVKIFMEMFTHDETLNFWVIETRKPSRKIVGCIGMIYLDLKTSRQTTHMSKLMEKHGIEKAFEVKRMSVDPSHRGKGVAKRLLKLLIREVKVEHKDIDEVVLATTEFQQPAISLYKRHSFEEMFPLFRVKNQLSRIRFNVHYFRLPLKRWHIKVLDELIDIDGIISSYHHQSYHKMISRC